MESFLIYIGKSAIAAGVFYIAFLLLFQNRKQFVFNRIYLPVSLMLSFIIPLITFTTVEYIEPTATLDYSSFAYWADSTEFQPPAFEREWYHYIFGIYLLGTAGYLFHLLLGHLKAISIIRKSRIQKLFESLVNITQKDVHPFSFFTKIVLSEKTLSHPNLDIIINHENIHVKEKHTFDILFTEILFLLQWFNPFVWLIKDAVKNNLEYKTDHEIIKTNDPQTYQLAMVTLADKKSVTPFLTALNGSQLKNRIIMMKKKTGNKYTLVKQLVILPLLAILIMGLSNKEVKTKIIQPGETTQNITLQDMNISGKVFSREDGKPLGGVGVYNKLGDKLASSNPNGEFSFISKKEKSDIILLKSGFQPKYLEIDPSQKNEDNIAAYLNIQVNVEDEKEMVEKVILNYSKGENGIGPVWYKPDKMPEFPGGKTALKKYISDNIKYPESAINKGIIGNVLVTFIVSKEGKAIAPRITGSVCPSLDKEALRLISTLPEWSPGNENGNSVNTWYTVPVEFNITATQPQPLGKNIMVHSDLPKTQKTETKATKDTKKHDPRINKVEGFSNDPNSLMNRWSKGNPLFIVDGKERVSLHDLDPKLIKNATVLKDASAIDLYGPKAKNGVVIISTKQPVKAGREQLYIVDGKEISYNQMGEIPSSQIAGVDVLKGKTATNLYGKKAKNGAILITTKKPVETGREQLYIVDGKEISYNQMKKISPDRIASISVLKGEAATNLYGEKGNNGVIVVLTKGSKVVKKGELPIVLNGKMTELTLNEVDQDLIKNIKRIEPKKAIKKYGERGKNGVFEVTSRKPNPNSGQ